MAEILKGKPVADKLAEEIRKMVTEKTSTLGIIRVGENPDDIAYEKGALSQMNKLGISTKVFVLDSNITQESFVSFLKEKNADDSIDGILVFRPLPNQLKEEELKNIISPEKDVDCFNPLNLAKVMENDKSGMQPCTASAVIEMLEYNNIDYVSKRVVIIGRSLTVGKSLAVMLINKNATVTICHSKTPDLKSVTKEADILIVAVGKAKMIDDSYIKNGAIVIDVGINFDENGMCGDVDFDKVEPLVSGITPVPGGVGSITTIILARNLMKNI
ncbi:MAG: bifunctional 5,10-methylenetetrahydrofolate dehydrogenase/5,10-methenyltetrahydrofolate cyclohydrolase [Filifactoraceae bacterium]